MGGPPPKALSAMVTADIKGYDLVKIGAMASVRIPGGDDVGGDGGGGPPREGLFVIGP